MEGIITELLRFAFSGVNIIPTMMLILIQCYWLVASIGFLDLDFLDFDVDIEGAESSGLFNALAVFINFGEVPITLVFTFIALDFWILTMLMYYLPIKDGGLISGILLAPSFVLSLYITRFQVRPLKDKYLERTSHNDIGHRVLDKRCRLKSDLEYGRLGQAEIRKDGVHIVINVHAQFEDESFQKDEFAFVFRKDEEKDVYYISKLVMGSEFYKELEEL